MQPKYEKSSMTLVEQSQNRCIWLESGWVTQPKDSPEKASMRLVMGLQIGDMRSTEIEMTLNQNQILKLRNFLDAALTD